MRRVWGGRLLESEYHRQLPDDAPYGESWELSDRENEQSVVATGPLAGRTLHELWQNSRAEIFGEGLPDSPRFPLLVKILDARRDLSIQVHPPARVAAALGGEPKTEMWYIAAADPGAKLYVGLKAGTSRSAFEAAIADGSVPDLVHVIEPTAGESIFIPSGRLHAIGGGFLIYEIQQNSDTTYRVFDWNRPGLDGKPRALHVRESLASIDFADFEPDMNSPMATMLATCDSFQVEKLSPAAGEPVGNARADRFSILALVSGRARSADGESYGPGDFLLLPRGASAVIAESAAVFLRTTIP